MAELLQWLLANPLILILLIGWLFSMLGGVMTQAARRAAQQQQQQQQQQRGERGTPPAAGAGGTAPARGEPRPAPPPRTEPRPATAPRRAEDIARELRRMLGVDEPPELVERPVVVAPPRPLPTVAKRDAPRPVEPAAAAHESLEESLQKKASRRAAREQHRSDAFDRRSSIRADEVATPEVRSARAARLRLAGTRLAELVVVREILGPPIALRADRF